MHPRIPAALLGSRRPLCASCAREARLAVAGAPASQMALSLSTPSLTPAARRPTQPTISNPSLIRQRQPLSQSSRNPSSVQAQSQPQTPSRDDPESPESSSPSSSRETPPTDSFLFYALFPKTLPLGPPPKGPFHIDVRALRTEFLQLQATAHPDFHHHASQGQADPAAPAEAEKGNTKEGPPSSRRHSAARARAEALSARINEAYRTLASPLLRAQYLLRQRYRIDLAGDEGTLWGGGDAQGGAASDTELLMAVLEVREDIERAVSEADLEPIRAANDARMRASEDVLAEAFATDDPAAARREAVRLRYWVNIDDSLCNWERGKDVVLEH